MFILVEKPLMYRRIYMLRGRRRFPSLLNGRFAVIHVQMPRPLRAGGSLAGEEAARPEFQDVIPFSPPQLALPFGNKFTADVTKTSVCVRK